jgi:hypothetical protein
MGELNLIILDVLIEWGHFRPELYFVLPHQIHRFELFRYEAEFENIIFKNSFEESDVVAAELLNSVVIGLFNDVGQHFGVFELMEIQSAQPNWQTDELFVVDLQS